jgi:NAD(P)-dependent dehydrogenase (short-subunit alcohol dehydrogenase family)
MPTAERLTDRRVCVITGAGGRLGSDFCRRYGDQYEIVAVSRSRVPNVRTQDQWHVDPLRAEAGPSAGSSVYSIVADLTEPGALDEVVERALGRCGRIDLLVNAAVFVQRERLTTLADRTEFLDRAFHLNATVPLALAATVVRAAWADTPDENRILGRNVINISSGAGLGYAPFPGLSAYSASKAALNFLTCYLADELGGIGVRVNAIAPTTFPGLIPTEAVSDEIVAVDSSAASGQIIELNEVRSPVPAGQSA